MEALLSWLKFDVGEGAFYSAFGFLFVFLGIALLVGIFTVLGLVMKKLNGRKPRKRKIKTEQVFSEPASPGTEELSEETVAAIIAAIAAMYESENAKCEFVVRRIKRL